MLKIFFPFMAAFGLASSIIQAQNPYLNAILGHQAYIDPSISYTQHTQQRQCVQKVVDADTLISVISKIIDDIPNICLSKFKLCGGYPNPQAPVSPPYHAPVSPPYQGPVSPPYQGPESPPYQQGPPPSYQQGPPPQYQGPPPLFNDWLIRSMPGGPENSEREEFVAEEEIVADGYEAKNSTEGGSGTGKRNKRSAYGGGFGGSSGYGGYGGYGGSGYYPTQNYGGYGSYYPHYNSYNYGGYYNPYYYGRPYYGQGPTKPTTPYYYAPNHDNRYSVESYLLHKNTVVDPDVVIN